MRGLDLGSMLYCSVADFGWGNSSEDNLSLCAHLNESEAETPLTTETNVFRLVAELYLISIFCVVGLVGNSMSLLVLRRDRERRQSLILLQTLAIADSLYLLVALFRYPLKYVVPDLDTYTVMQPVVLPLLKTCQTICIWMMVLVTTERFIYVCNPLHANLLFSNSKRRVLGSLVFVLGVIYNLPRFFAQCILYMSPCNRDAIMIYRERFMLWPYRYIYLNGLYMALLYVAPLVTLCVMNVKLILAIRRAGRRQRVTLATGKNNNNLENNATLVLVIIILIFIICETPELLLRLLVIVHRYCTSIPLFAEVSNNGLQNCTTVSELLMAFNSSVNFFIYVIFGKRFRVVLKETFTHSFRVNSSAPTPETFPLYNKPKPRRVIFKHKACPACARTRF